MEEAEEADVKLSSFALDALAAFYNERDAREKQFEDLKVQAEDEFDQKKFSMDAFAEDWNASQFWYSDDTAIALAKQLIDGADSTCSIAVVSAPSVFIQLKNLLTDVEPARRPTINLLEFDERFAVFKEFVFYDYVQPLKLPGTTEQGIRWLASADFAIDNLKSRFDRVICDPPFLSADCQTKAAMTVRWLSRSTLAQDQKSQAAPDRLIVCTGERMGELVTKLYEKSHLRTTTFEVVHTNGLSNEFRCYANFSCDIWTDAE